MIFILNLMTSFISKNDLLFTNIDSIYVNVGSVYCFIH